MRITIAILLLVVLPIAMKADSAPGAIQALAFSPDGKRLAVGSYGQVVIYDTSAWQMTSRYLKVADTVRSLAFDSSGQTLAIGSGLPGRTGRIDLWDTAGTGQPLRCDTAQDTIEAVCFRPDGKGLLAGANDNMVRYYPALPDNGCKTLDEHNGRVSAVAFSPKGDFFVTGGMDKVVKVWDMSTTKTVVNFDQSEGGITGLAFLPNGHQFVGSSLDGRLYWWQVNEDARTHTFNGNRYRTADAHPGGVFALGASGDGKRLITGGADNMVIVWEAAGGKKLQTFKECTQPLYAVALSPDGAMAAAAGREGVVRIWNVDGNQFVTTLTPPALPAPPVHKTAPTKHAAHKHP